MKRAALYARVSGDDRERHSLAEQLRLCRQHAQERGYIVTAELTEDDRGVSGTRLDAPALTRLLELADQGQIDAVICREMDRLARTLAKQIWLEDYLSGRGVVLDYCLADYPDTPEGQLSKHIRAVISEYERLKVVERMTRGRSASVRRGNVMVGGNEPYGYRVTSVEGLRGLVVVEQEAAIVRRMFEWYAHGDDASARISLREIASRLSGQAIPTPAHRTPRYAHLKRSARCRWSPTVVRQILGNPAYKGEWTFNAQSGEAIVVECPAVVDVVTWERVQRRFGENRRYARRNVKHDYLLRGRITCGQCGYRMFGCRVTGKSGVYVYYRCPATMKRTDLARECDARMVRGDRLDDQVWRVVVGLFSNPADLQEAYDEWQAQEQKRTGPIEERLKEIDAQMDRAKTRLGRLLELYLDGDMTRQVLFGHQAQLEERLEALDDEHRRLTAQRSGLSGHQVWANLLEFAEAVQGELATTDEFEERLWYVDRLDVQVTVTVSQAVVRAHDEIIGLVDL